MTPASFLETILNPGLLVLQHVTGMPPTDQARVLMLAIAGQESGWESRRQVGGPARGFWQFERGGGVRGVLTHPASGPRIKAVCDTLRVPADEATVFEAIAWHDHLAVAMARLLLWTDPAPLPVVGALASGWECYVRNWRPGKPHRDAWTERYDAAMAAISGSAA